MDDDPKKTGPKDVFMQLLAIGLLYFTAVNFGVILFQVLNIYLPDILANQSYHVEGALDKIRWGVATLVIAFPIFVWLNRYLEKELARFPEKRELRTRQWLIHLTLFLAAAVIIADLVTLVYNFLEGELTLRFILKVLVVLFLAVSVFKYYLWALRENLAASVMAVRRIFVWATIVVVAAVIGVGFATAGLPQSQRLKKFDDKRVSDLSGIQSQIVYFWQSKNRLPENLDQLYDSLTGYKAPMDPQTLTAYVYERTSDLKFKLCADFSTVSSGKSANRAFYAPPMPYPGSYIGNETFNNWQHEAGKVCFERMIDPDLYRQASRLEKID